MPKKLKIFTLLLILTFSITGLLSSTPTYAVSDVTDANCPSGTAHPKIIDTTTKPPAYITQTDKCADIKKAGDCISGAIDKNDSTRCAFDTCASTQQDCLAKNPLIKDVQTIVNALSAVAGVVIVIMIMIGGIRYSIARDNPQSVSAARDTIRNALVALIFYLLMFGLLQWLIPGGVFG